MIAQKKHAQRRVLRHWNVAQTSVVVAERVRMENVTAHQVSLELHVEEIE